MEPLWVRRFDWIPADLDMVGRLFGSGLRHHGDYRHVDAAFGLGAELDVTVYEGEQGVISAQADIASGMPLGAALARQDVAGHDGFTAENLEPEALAIGVAAVARGAACFFVSHGRYPECPGFLTRICVEIIT
jgi:hypothetical protein